MDFSWSHILLFLVVALVVVGPKDLPKLMRKIGQWVAKARNMADQFRSSFDEMARQTELDELRKEIDALRNAKPLAETEKALNEALTVPSISLDRQADQAEPGPRLEAEPSQTGQPETLAQPEAATPVGEPNQAQSLQVPPPPQAEPGPGLEAEQAPDPNEPELPLEGGYTPPTP